jgi:hypothetical protein
MTHETPPRFRLQGSMGGTLDPDHDRRVDAYIDHYRKTGRWSGCLLDLDPDPLTVVPDPEPPRSRFGCAWIEAFLGVVLICIVAGLAAPKPALTAAVPTREGTWAYAERSHGSGYLAIPEGRGWVVIVCGPLDCIERVSTDAGPALYLQRAGRIGDLAAVMFEDVCGPLSAGLCSGSYTIIGRPDQHPEDPPEHPDDARMRLEDMALPRTDTR